MKQTPKQLAGALVLTGAMTATPSVTRSLEEQLAVPAIRMTVPRTLPPLDLDAPFFRYRMRKVPPVSQGAHACSEGHPARHRR